jgi:hypothetical protein
MVPITLIRKCWSGYAKILAWCGHFLGFDEIIGLETGKRLRKFSFLESREQARRLCEDKMYQTNQQFYVQPQQTQSSQSQLPKYTVPISVPNAQQQGGSTEEEKIFALIQDLLNPTLREAALLELSKRRETFEDLAPVLWFSYGIFISWCLVYLSD